MRPATINTQKKLKTMDQLDCNMPWSLLYITHPTMDLYICYQHHRLLYHNKTEDHGPIGLSVENFNDKHPVSAIICLAVVNNVIVSTGSVQMKSMFVQNEHVTKTYTDILLGMQFNEADNAPDQAPDDNIVSIPYSSVLETNVYDLDYINGTEEECVETVNHDPIEPQETGEGDKVVQETDEEQVGRNEQLTHPQQMEIAFIMQCPLSSMEMKIYGCGTEFGFSVENGG
ncbi:unnamed protein product [Mytilus coruscus]|uniref:Uncharacterized protein n=1 Tax=Mytilus coruscus TaxID=42192 RepID=A0A6J8AAX6_MYTCO|nr:unnamed protein product [Mytilus coruscus]